jgi:hypothetical protein
MVMNRGCRGAGGERWPTVMLADSGALQRPPAVCIGGGHHPSPWVGDDGGAVVRSLVPLFRAVRREVVLEFLVTRVTSRQRPASERLAQGAGDRLQHQVGGAGSGLPPVSMTTAVAVTSSGASSTATMSRWSQLLEPTATTTDRAAPSMPVRAQSWATSVPDSPQAATEVAASAEMSISPSAPLGLAPRWVCSGVAGRHVMSPVF